MRTLSELNQVMESSARARALPAYAKALAIVGSMHGAADLMEQQYGSRSPMVEHIKAAVAAITVSDSPGAYLAANLKIASAFMEFARKRTLLGQITNLTVPAPPNARVPTATALPSAAWVQDGAPIPATNLELELSYLDITKLASILAVSAEWLKLTDERTTSLFERLLQRAIRDVEDEALLSSDAAVAATRPAGLLFGISASGAGSPGDVGDDLQSLWRSVRDGEPEAPVFICSPRGAVYLATLTSGEAPLFPDVSPMGGRIWGVPQLAAKAAEDKLILLDAGALVVSDLGLTIERANHAAVQMDTAPSAGAAALVSSFQTNTTLLKLVRYVNWKLGYADGVAFITLPLGSPA